MNTGDIAVATLIDEHFNEALVVYFRMPKFGDEDFYCQSVSLEWFRERQSKLIGKCVKRCRVGTDPWIEDESKLTILSTVWAMYEAVGYDLNTKRFKEL